MPAIIPLEDVKDFRQINDMEHATMWLDLKNGKQQLSSLNDRQEYSRSINLIDVNTRSAEDSKIKAKRCN